MANTQHPLRQVILDLLVDNKNTSISFQKIKEHVEASDKLSAADKSNLSEVIKDILKSLEQDGLVKNFAPKGSSRKTQYKYIRPKSSKGPIDTIETISDTNYIGRAGEYAVMSELMFLGYDVNLMTIDKGQDLIAHKNGDFVYIQVKTTSIDNSGQRATWQIKTDIFNKFSEKFDMFYVLVLRCKANGKPQNRFFTFSSQEIQTFHSQDAIGASNNAITIKIRYDGATPKLYHTKEIDITRWESFESIEGRRIQPRG